MRDARHRGEARGAGAEGAQRVVALRRELDVRADGRRVRAGQGVVDGPGRDLGRTADARHALVGVRQLAFDRDGGADLGPVLLESEQLVVARGCAAGRRLCSDVFPAVVFDDLGRRLDRVDGARGGAPLAAAALQFLDGDQVDVGCLVERVRPATRRRAAAGAGRAGPPRGLAGGQRKGERRQEGDPYEVRVVGRGHVRAPSDGRPPAGASRSLYRGGRGARHRTRVRGVRCPHE